jgi:hypothetical protein
MKLASGAQALPFGHRIEPAVDVEGLVVGCYLLGRVAI